MADLVVRGGTVVTATGSRVADVAVEGGRITAIEADLSGPASTARDVVDASGLLVLPGVVDVHTHTRVGSDAEPDRFFQDSVAAAFGGTTTFLSFNNPGTGSSSAAARSLAVGLREWQAATAADAAVDVGLSLVVTADQPDAITEMPGVIEAGVPTLKAFMVYDFGVDDATLLRALATAGERGGMLEVHCENRTILETLTARHLDAGETAPRYHASSRPPYVEARPPSVRSPSRGRPTHRCTSSISRRRRPSTRCAGVARPGQAVFAETCPHYLTLTDERYDASPEEAARYVISPPLRSPGNPEALWDGLADGSLALIATDHVPDRVAVEKQSWRESFDRISNGGPGIETLLAMAWDGGVATGRITVERLVDLLSTTPARLFGLRSKGAVEVGRDADLVLFDPAARRTIRAQDLHHTSDYTPYEGHAVQGAVRSTIVRGSFVVRDGTFVGSRGFGRFVERRLDPMR